MLQRCFVAKFRLVGSGCFVTVAILAAAYTLSVQSGRQFDPSVVSVAIDTKSVLLSRRIDPSVANAAIDTKSVLLRAAINRSGPGTCEIKSIDRLPHSYAGGKYLRQQCKGPFGSSKPDDKRRLVILLRGESFRGLKGMYDRTVNVDNKTFRCQSDASESHVKYIIEPFESCGFEVDVIVNTWRAHDEKWGKNSSQQLIDMYGGRVVQAHFGDHTEWEKIGRVMTKITPQATNYLNGLYIAAEFANRTGTSWDALVVIRSDLVFKKTFGNAKFDKVLLAFKEWSLMPDDMVGDTIHWLPWRFLNCAIQDGFKEHYSTSLAGRVGGQNFGFIEKTLHDTNSMADWNPLYKMCRPEQKYNVDGGFGLMMFSVRPFTKDKLESSGASVRHALFLQGSPRALPPADLVYHLSCAWASTEYK